MKLWLILSWWWTCCAYTAGVMHAFANQKIFFDYIVAGSGSAGTWAYYTAWQYKCMYDIRKYAIVDKKFIDIKRFWKPIDVDYLIDDIFTIQYSLDTTAVHNSKTEFFIAVTCQKVGKVNYFSNRDNEDIMNILRATKSIPFLCESVKIWDDYYQDGSNSSGYWCHISYLQQKWCDKIIIIDNWIRMPKIATILYTQLKSKKFCKNYRDEYALREKYFQLIQHESDIKIISPSRPLQCGWKWILNNDSDFLQQCLHLGYSDGNYFLDNNTL